MKRRRFLGVLAAAATVRDAGWWRGVAGRSGGELRGRSSPPSFRPEWWGARGVAGGSPDDTEAVRRALRAAYDAGGGQVALEPGRVYVVTTLPLFPGITIEGNGATLLRKPESVGKWTRILNALHPAGVRWRGAGDSPLTVIRRLRVDGNRDRQSRWKGGHDLEQAHCIFLSADGSRGGRLRVLVDRCATVNNVADGLSIHSDVDVEVRDHYAEDCFRGGITVLAGPSTTRVDGYQARGRERATAVHIEVEGNHRADVSFSHCRLERGLIVIPGRASVTRLHDVVMEAPPYYFTGWSANGSRTGRVLVTDSVLPGSAIQPGAGRASAAFHPANLEFRNVTFRIAKPAGTERRAFCGMLVEWHRSRRGQGLRLEDCRFEVDRDSFDGSERVFGIHSNPDRDGWETAGTLERVRFGPGLDWALHVDRGGTWRLRDVTSLARGLVRWKWSRERYLDLELAAVDHLGAGDFLRNATGGFDAHNRIACRDIEMPERQDRLGGRTVGARIEGARTILVDASPVGRAVPGLRGDVCLLRTPAGDRRWVAASSSTTAAEWRALSG